MIENLTGDLFVKANQKFCLVVAEFNEFITSRLAKAATECLLRHGAKETQITQIWVPGCFEIPTVASQAAKSGKYSVIICLGCVVRGQTGHYDHVADQVSRGVGAIGPATGVPTLFGVITADTLEQAIDRAGAKGGNAGWSAACGAISMVSVMAKLRGEAG
jgi:6,7-dimethyl-8-ribityllumazine synthase